VTRWISAGVVAMLLSATALSGSSGEPPPTLHGRTHAAWVDVLRPEKEQSRWLEIPWLSSFGEGLQAASRQEMPLLLWVMNGHPLGCT